MTPWSIVVSHNQCQDRDFSSHDTPLNFDLDFSHNGDKDNDCCDVKLHNASGDESAERLSPADANHEEFSANAVECHSATDEEFSAIDAGGYPSAEVEEEFYTNPAADDDCLAVTITSPTAALNAIDAYKSFLFVHCKTLLLLEKIYEITTILVRRSSKE